MRGWWPPLAGAGKQPYRREKASSYTALVSRHEPDIIIEAIATSMYAGVSYIIHCVCAHKHETSKIEGPSVYKYVIKTVLTTAFRVSVGPSHTAVAKIGRWWITDCRIR